MIGLLVEYESETELVIRHASSCRTQSRFQHCLDSGVFVFCWANWAVVHLSFINFTA